MGRFLPYIFIYRRIAVLSSLYIPLFAAFSAARGRVEIGCRKSAFFLSGGCLLFAEDRRRRSRPRFSRGALPRKGGHPGMATHQRTPRGCPSWHRRRSRCARACVRACVRARAQFRFCGKLRAHALSLCYAHSTNFARVRARGVDFLGRVCYNAVWSIVMPCRSPSF